MRNVQFPFAKRDEQTLVHISKYVDGPSLCIGCDAPMVAKQGEHRAWHFAHSAEVQGTCSGETALHWAAKAVVASSHAEARLTGRPYLISWWCRGCDQLRSFDAAVTSLSAEVEAMAIEGVRSDIFFRGPKPFAIEVVVTNEMSLETEERYAKAHVPVFVVRPRTWMDIESLRESVVATSAQGLPDGRCRHCRDLQATERSLEELFNRLKEELRNQVLLDRAVAARKLGIWPPANDPEGNRLFPRAQCMIQDKAIRLVSLGFEQRRSNSWVFERALPLNVGQLYVHLAGAHFVPAWSGYAASMGLSLRVPLRHQVVFGKLVEWYLRRNKISINDEWRDYLHARVAASRS